MVTMSDVARLAGVSVMTVSNVLNDRPYVKTSTRDRVLAAVAELGYEINLSARHLRSGQTGTVGLIVPRFSHPYFAELADALASELTARGRHLAVEQSEASREHELAALSRARLQRYDAIVLSVAGLEREELATLAESPPVVLLGEREMPARFDHLQLANIEGARLATTRLLDSGARRVAVVGGDLQRDDATARLRTDGWIAAHEERGLPVDERLVLSDGRYSAEEAHDAVIAAHAAGLDPDGYFAITDDIATGVLAALHRLGRAVPEEIGVVGYDNLVASAWTVPALTTIDAGRAEVARTIADLIERRIADPSASPRHLVGQVRLIERDSVAPLP